jgi:hypothetical protein
MAEVKDFYTGRTVATDTGDSYTTLRSLLPETRNGRFATVAAIAAIAIGGALNLWHGTPNNQQADAFHNREMQVLRGRPNPAPATPAPFEVPAPERLH